MTRERLLSVWLAAGLIVVLAACGSTVQPSGGASGQAVLGAGAAELGAPVSPDGVPLPADVDGLAGSAGGLDAGGVDADVNAGAAGPAAEGTPGTASETGASSGARDPADATAAGSPMPQQGFGYDEKNVYIGVTLASDTSTALKTAGLNSVDAGDQFEQSRAMANYYNKQGGILGRKVQIRFDDHKSADLASRPDAESQATCEKFTQDEPVVAVINTQTLLDTPTLRACLKSRGLPLFGVTITAIDDKVLQESGGLYFPTLTPTWTKFAPVFVQSLSSRRFFTGWDTRAGAPGPAPVKVGAFIHEDAITERAFKELAAALAKAGHPVAEVFRYRDVGSGGSPAVLQMRSAGVTHMFALDPNIFVFATSAESQGYRPRYGLHTSNGPGLLFEANAPKAQSAGALAVGSAPSLDVLAFPGEITAAGKLCRDIMSANGQRFEGKRFAEAFAFSICDSVRLLAEASTAGGGFAKDPFLAGTARIAPQFKTGVTYASGLQPGYPILAGAGRDIEYRSSCSCFTYSNPNLRPF